MSTATDSAARPRWHLLRPLDRYVSIEFLRIFLVTSLGFPFLVFVVDLVDNLRKYTDRDIPAADIALSYWYFLPDTMSKVLPAAVLFATVFSVGNFTRYAEITAAKASGMSFHRFVMPIFVLSFFAAGLGIVIGELSPPANTIRLRLLRESCGASTAPSGARSPCNESSNTRYNFVFGGADGRIVRATFLNVQERTMQAVETEQRGDSLTPRAPALGGARELVARTRLAARGRLRARDPQRVAQRGDALRLADRPRHDGDAHRAARLRQGPGADDLRPALGVSSAPSSGPAPTCAACAWSSCSRSRCP